MFFWVKKEKMHLKTSATRKIYKNIIKFVHKKAENRQKIHQIALGEYYKLLIIIFSKINNNFLIGC